MNLANQSSKKFNIPTYFIQNFKKVNFDSTVFNKQHYITWAIFLLIYEAINHVDPYLKEELRTSKLIRMVMNNGFVALGSLDGSLYDLLKLYYPKKFSYDLKRLMEQYNIQEFIQINYQHMIKFQDNEIFLHAKSFLMFHISFGAIKNNKYHTINSYQKLDMLDLKTNLFSLIEEKDGNDTQDILYSLSLGLYINIFSGSKNNFSVSELTKSLDVNITRQVEQLKDCLYLLCSLGGIKDFEYNKRTNSFFISVNNVLQKNFLFNKKTFNLHKETLFLYARKIVKELKYSYTEIVLRKDIFQLMHLKLFDSH